MSHSLSLFLSFSLSLSLSFSLSFFLSLSLSLTHTHIRTHHHTRTVWALWPLKRRSRFVIVDCRREETFAKQIFEVKLREAGEANSVGEGAGGARAPAECRTRQQALAPTHPKGLAYKTWHRRAFWRPPGAVARAVFEELPASTSLASCVLESCGCGGGGALARS